MRFHHFAIEVKDLETSITFYRKYLGLHETDRLYFNEENIVFLANNEFRLELISGGQQKASQGIHICLEVENLQEIIRKFNEYAISALEGPYKLNNGWETVFYEGPDNEIIEFLQIREKADH
ncbi:VOC family protein [Neobacillus sp. YX16]|uniref:VOC family protein n=1 Tax=Neobacillus sp. YX16 TaxID=3047874 RepID=UPI0024C34F7A|nr:VOC family protein [Neobacillus sp. YX16]WHZ01868.1 VOC family protein [Neobacillus sp. YX16]